MKTKEEKLYEEAEARVNFKKHLKTYLLINAMIWLFWFLTRARFGHYDGYWPAYTTVGWGIGIVSHYLSVYTNNNVAIEKEVERLKKKRAEY